MTEKEATYLAKEFPWIALHELVGGVLRYVLGLGREATIERTRVVSGLSFWCGVCVGHGSRSFGIEDVAYVIEHLGYKRQDNEDVIGFLRRWTDQLSAHCLWARICVVRSDGRARGVPMRSGFPSNGPMSPDSFMLSDLDLCFLKEVLASKDSQEG